MKKKIEKSQPSKNAHEVSLSETKRNAGQQSQSPNQQYLSPELAAQVMGIKTSLLSNWRVSGNGPAYVKLGSGKRALVRYPLLGSNGLICYMESRIQSSTSDINAKKVLATASSCGTHEQKQIIKDQPL